MKGDRGVGRLGEGIRNIIESFQLQIKEAGAALQRTNFEEPVVCELEKT